MVEELRELERAKLEDVLVVGVLQVLLIWPYAFGCTFSMVLF